MPRHSEASALADKTMWIAKGDLAGRDIVIEDWWDRVAGKSWMHCTSNLACLAYAMTVPVPPLDDEVVYGKIGSFGALVHVTYLTELES